MPASQSFKEKLRSLLEGALFRETGAEMNIDKIQVVNFYKGANSANLLCCEAGDADGYVLKFISEEGDPRGEMGPEGSVVGNEFVCNNRFFNYELPSPWVQQIMEGTGFFYLNLTYSEFVEVRNMFWFEANGEKFPYKRVTY